MEIRTTSEAKENIESFTKRLLVLLKEKKKIDEDIKALKDECKEDGVPVQIVVGAMNRIKALKKKTDAQIFEEETVQEWLASNPDIDDAIGELSAK